MREEGDDYEGHDPEADVGVQAYPQRQASQGEIERLCGTQSLDEEVKGKDGEEWDQDALEGDAAEGDVPTGDGEQRRRHQGGLPAEQLAGQKIEGRDGCQADGDGDHAEGEGLCAPQLARQA